MKKYQTGYNYLLFVITLFIYQNTVQAQNNWYSVDTLITVSNGNHTIYLRNKINRLNESRCVLEYINEKDTFSMNIAEKNFYLLHDTFIRTQKSGYLIIALAGEPGDFNDYLLVRLRNNHIYTSQFRIYSEIYGLMNQASFKEYLIGLIPVLSEEPEDFTVKLIQLIKPE